MAQPRLAARLSVLLLAVALAVGCSPDRRGTGVLDDPTPRVIDCDTASQEDWAKYCAGDPPSEPPPKVNEALLPLRGGTFTFSNGVEVRVRTLHARPWGQHDKSDFGDPYAQVTLNGRRLVAEDTLLVLRYDVTVPKDFHADTLNVDLCAGTLAADNGNDEDALAEVTGLFARTLSGTMRPGQTKYGIQEFGLRKDYVDRTTFTYSNSCGDPDETLGEVGVWTGKVDPIP